MQDWTIRNENNVAIIRVEGEDYVEVPNTAQNYPAAYPDTVANAVLERGDGTLKVVLGHIRYFVEGDSINEVKTNPQTVWLQKVNADTEVVPAEEVESDKNEEGFITG